MILEAEVAYLHILDGVRQPEVPAGFAVHTAPRKAARGRDRDVLMVGLCLSPGAPNDLMGLIANTYFGTPGSVTAAARATFAAASARLFDFNRYPPSAGPVNGGLCCAILRGADLYVALSGVGQVIVVHPNAVERFPDPANEPLPPFGLAQSADVHYFHTIVAASDCAVFSASVPAGWETNTITHLTGAGLESAVARLTRMAGAHASAMIARFAAEGAAPAKTRPAITAAPLAAATAHAEPAPAPESAVEAPAPLPITAVEETPPPPPVVTPAEPASQPEPEPDTSSLAGIIARVRASPAMGSAGAGEAVPMMPAAEPPPAQPARPAPAEEHEEEIVQIGDHVYEFEEDDVEEEIEGAAEGQPLSQRLRAGLKRWLANLPLNRASEAMKQGSEVIGASLSTSSAGALRRLLPEGAMRPGTLMRVPDRLLVAIAILFPVIIGLVVGAVYVQRGRNEEFRNYLDQARFEAGLARVQPDSLSAKPHWQNALTWLDQADAIFPGQPEAAALRAEAQSQVDAVDGIQRLPLEPLVPGGFGGSAKITEVVVNGSEVYALDSTRQSVHRAILTEGDKFVIDRAFQCEAGVVGAFVIDKIVDIAWLNTPNVVGQPALLVMDDDGILMYCKPDGSPPEASQLIAPDTGWKAPKAVEIYADRLYIFDPGANDIWQYDRSGGVFSERPKPYFTGQVLDLSTAVGFTITQGEVYILRLDGRLVFCVRDPNTLQPNCVENALFSDSRPGHLSGDRLDDVIVPVQLYYDPPPEPSLYLLDTATSGIHQLSLKLVLQRQFRSSAGLPGPITAVAIGPNKEMFVASGNNVYWARR